MASSADETLRRAVSAMQAGQAEAAERLFKQALQSAPDHLGALNLFGLFLTSRGRFDEAERYVLMALKAGPDSEATLYNYGVILKALKRPKEALERFSQALQINASVAETWNNRGTVFNDLKRYREAVTDFEQATAINANYAEAFFNKGGALARLRLYAESLVAYDRVLAFNPQWAEAWIARGNVLTELKQDADASAAFDRALALQPSLAGAWLGRGNVLANIAQYENALACFDKALALKPNLGEAFMGRGSVFLALKQYDAAFTAYDKALAIDPDLAEAWHARANAFFVLRQYAKAASAYDSALKLDADLKYAEGRRLHARLHICDWSNVEFETSHVLTGVREARLVCPPFETLAMSSSAADQLLCAKSFIRDLPPLAAVRRGENYSHERIRIGYLSGDFREHATAILLARLFEQHDRSRFEVTGISFGPNQNSSTRQRIERASEHFIDVREKSDQEVAELIRRLEIDIVVDLMGLTGDNRLNILARRPAPIQVSYLGYIGTMGADFIDYVIADEIALPFDQQPFFAEKIVHLPGCFLVTDDRQEIAAHTPSREEAGLPPDGFVFCSFNNSYKLAKRVFEVWMRLLAAVPGSVLWLAQANPDMATNLRREAQRCGIAPDRIIFAPRVPLPRHLARQRLAGLFLDTVPYNAGATGAAALWSGIPLLTVLGQTFVGRMAASMLHAVGLPELVAQNLEDYEVLALKLVRDPHVLSGIRRQLKANLRVTPLFDTDRFRRHLEAAYNTMVDICRRGESPTSFRVERM
ncbi:MAG: tetratricopeptide repeat protein [Xanthobacteraceae bacterium]